MVLVSKNSIFLMGLLCLFGFDLFSQEVKGVVQSDSIGILGVNIVLYSYPDSQIVYSGATADDGVFVFENQQKDSVFLQAFALGFKPFSSSLFLGAKDFGVIGLKSDGELDTAVITVKKPFREISAHGTSFNIDANPLLKVGTAKRLLQKLPGVQIRQGSNINVNGKDNATVYVNGRRTYMDGKALVQYLQSIPADQIVRVELFDTPPARFDAEGNGAIINVVLKKPPLGTNGRVYTEQGYGNYYKSGTMFFMNHRTEKFNVYGGMRWRSQFTNNRSQDSTLLGTQGDYLLNKGTNFIKQNVYDGKVGLDYFQNEKNTFGVYYEMISRNENHSHITNTNVHTSVIDAYDFFKGDEGNQEVNNRQHLSLDFNRSVNDSVNLSVDVRYLKLGINSDITTWNDLYNQGVLIERNLTKADAGVDINILTGRVDYTAALRKKWSVDAGVKYSYIFNDNSFLSKIGSNTSNLVVDTNVSNDFRYTESIVAGYVSLKKSWTKQWKTDIGARVEQTNVVGDSPTENLKFTKNYFNFFPNVSVVFAPSKLHQFSALYSRRIERPNTVELNPFLKRVNELEFKSGNYDLNPMINNVVNLKYTFMEALNLTLEGGRAQSYYAEVVNQDLSTGVRVWRPENIGTGEYFNVNLGSPIPITKWWGAYVHFTYLYARLDSPPNHYELNSFTTYMGNEFTLPKKWTIGLSGWYAHNTFWNIWRVNPAYSINFMVTKEWKRWTFGLEVFDPLNMTEYSSRALYNDLNMYTEYKEESRKFFLNATFNFGNKKIKEARKRGLSEEERKRIK